MLLTKWFEEGKWTKYHSAVDMFGNPVKWDSDQAVAWDLTTAVRISYPEDEYEKILFKLKSMQKLVFSKLYNDCMEVHADGKKFSPLFEFNDHPNVSWEHIRKLLVLMDV